MEYKNEIVKYNGKWRAFAFNHEAALLLNRRLRAYSVADQDWNQSEGVFDFTDKDLPYVRAVLTKLGGLERTEAAD